MNIEIALFFVVASNLSVKKYISGKNVQVNLIKCHLYGLKFARKIKVWWRHAMSGILDQFFQKEILEISSFQAFQDLTLG